MASKIYIITAQTHLHVGSGSSNAGIIDNLVQRDPTDNLPCIFASSLKGAFREYFEEGSQKAITKPLSNEIFGGSIEQQSTNKNLKGSHIFHQASILSLPARSNVKPFFNATCPSVLNKFKDDCAFLEIKINGLDAEINIILEGKNIDYKIDVISEGIPSLKIEDYSNFNYRALSIPNVKSVFGDNLILMTDRDFMDLCSDYNLPVIARNNLENGQSKNLWYEQIVPRQSRFNFCTVSFSSTDFFDTNVNGKSIQIGANASIGYGLCLVNNLNTQLL